MATTSLHTTRLLLRPWRPEDRPLFAKMNMDSKVMEHFPASLLPAESDQLVDKIQAHFDKYGFGLWAVEVPGVAPFIGFIGLLEVGFAAEFTPAIEIGWRLDAVHWGKGYAVEGAKRVVKFAFEEAELSEIVSLTACTNLRSQKVMERIGMAFDLEFAHPKLPDGHRLKQHVLYRLARSGYTKEHA